MTTLDKKNIQTAEMLLTCNNLNETLQFFIDKLGFKMESIAPAEKPSLAVISGYGIRIRLEPGNNPDPGSINLLCSKPASVADGKLKLTAPNGTIVNLIEANPSLNIQKVKQTFLLTKMKTSDQWSEGRAGMWYRDLIPDRQGGYAVASHIRILDGGPVPDYVHYHKILFQMIYCYKGWARLVYEDQGEPFVIEPGDCVLQPPQIRHQVLESSPGMEVIELTCPADHETCVDHEIKLPTSLVDPERLFNGQNFIRHEATKAEWIPWRMEGFEARDIGIASATDGLAGVRVAHPVGQLQPEFVSHDADLLFMFLLNGSAELNCDQMDSELLTAGDSFIIPGALKHSLSECSENMEVLEVALPAMFNTNHHPKMARLNS
jgi:quercetin dioxygenase-like cupin family protein